MKTTRIKFLVSNLVFFAFSSFGQSSVSVHGGASFATRQFKESGTIKPKEYGWVTGFNVGGNYEFEINELLSLTGGVSLVSRGYKSYSTIKYTNHYFEPPMSSTHHLEYFQHFFYLDFPVNLKLKYEIERNAYFFGRVGPYLGYTISGNHTTIGVLADSTGIYFNPGEAKYDLQLLPEPRLDIGANFSFGVEIKQFFFETTYSTGLRNMVNLYAKDVKTKNRTVLLNLGYRFKF